MKEAPSLSGEPGGGCRASLNPSQAAVQRAPAGAAVRKVCPAPPFFVLGRRRVRGALGSSRCLCLALLRVAPGPLFLAFRTGQVGAIIGRGGDTLRQIKAESGAIIVLSQETKGQGFSTCAFCWK